MTDAERLAKSELDAELRAKMVKAIAPLIDDLSLLAHLDWSHEAWIAFDVVDAVKSWGADIDYDEVTARAVKRRDAEIARRAALIESEWAEDARHAPKGGDRL